MPVHYRGTAAEVRALDAYVKLVRCAAAVQARLDGHLRTLGFTENQFGVLEALLHLGPLEQHRLGEKLFTSRPNVSLLCDQLEQRGLVRRVRVPNDRRRVVVELTAEGRRAIERAFPRHLGVIVAELSALDAGEQQALARLCKRLGVR